MSFAAQPAVFSTQNQQLPEVGKVFTFQGRTLEPYSYGRDALFSRLTFGDASLTGRAAAVLTIYICTVPEKRCVAIRRQEDIDNFHLECAKWADALGVHPGANYNEAAVSELLAVYDEIFKDVKKVEGIAPKIVPGAAPGNE